MLLRDTMSSISKILTPYTSELETIVKRINAHLTKQLGYPDITSDNFRCEGFIEKRTGKKGRFDGLYFDGGKTVLLLEAKKYGKGIKNSDVQQLLDYAGSPNFKPFFPPLLLASDGDVYQWFQLSEIQNEQPVYKEISEIKWSQARSLAVAPIHTPLVSAKQLINIFKKIRRDLNADLARDAFDPSTGKWTLENLTQRERKGIEDILEIRELYQGETFDNKSDQIKAAVASVALSFTMKICFLKVLIDMEGRQLDDSLLEEMAQLSGKYGKLFKTPPYDMLKPSQQCVTDIESLLQRFDSKNALLYDTELKNPIGQLYEALIDELQVETLGAVFTPDDVVEFMCDLAEKRLDGLTNKKIFEPACGSGHFVREIYRRYVDEIKAASPKITVEAILNAHKSALTNIRAVDIDAFSCQATLFAIFLEQIQEQGIVFDQLFEEKGKWMADSMVICGDSLQKQSCIEADFIPDMIVGNPPYGVDVVSSSIVNHYKLGAKDSYGYFIANAIERLSINGRVLFIVNGSMMTLKTHEALRKKVLAATNIIEIIQMHRHTFPGRDVSLSPIILHLQKNKEIVEDEELEQTEEPENVYRYHDMWSVHPKHNRDVMLDCFSNVIDMGQSSRIKAKELGQYEVSQSLVGQAKLSPLVGGSPTLFLLCRGTELENHITRSRVRFHGIKDPIECLEIAMPQGNVRTVELEQIADVKVGLQTGDNRGYIFKRSDIQGGPIKGGYLNVNKELISPASTYTNLSEKKRKALIDKGIAVVDYKRDKYFIPYDKGGENDSDTQEISNFWSAPQYWINWSARAVKSMKNSDEARFQNSQYYFKKGITFSISGQYSPTFRLSHGGVFDVKGSCLFPKNDKYTHYLLGILCSNLIRYFSKVFIYNSIDMQVGAVKRIPIAVPTEAELEDISNVTLEIIENIKKDNIKKIIELKESLEIKIHAIYKLDQGLSDEINDWFNRRYHILAARKLVNE